MSVCLGIGLHPRLCASKQTSIVHRDSLKLELQATMSHLSWVLGPHCDQQDVLLTAESSNIYDFC